MMKLIFQTLVLSVAARATADAAMGDTTADQTNAFLAALESRDLDTIAAMFDQNVNFSVPFSFSGNQGPARTVVGKDQLVQYYQDGFQTVSALEYVDVTVSVTGDGKTSFAQCNGQESSTNGLPYLNMYIYRFDWNNSLLTNIMEYTNPITFCQVFNDPDCAILPVD
jgi:ketosteroid isomerase-like protein